MKILSEVLGSRTIAISGHEKPDGDAVGACLALAMYLDRAMSGATGARPRIDVYLENFPESLKKNIPGQQFIRGETAEEDIAYDAFILLDTGKDRLGKAERLYDLARRRINIDHHISNPGDGDVAFVDPERSSTCELLYETMDPSFVDRDIAQALYVGMVTDTGVFRYSNTSGRTLQIAALLLEHGFDFSRVVQEVFFEKTYVQQKLMGRALSEAELRLDGRLITSVIDSAAMKSLGARKEDIDGISSELILTEGVDCAVFMHEQSAGFWRLSLRSGGNVDVAAIAQDFDGGGHVRASGCSYSGADPEGMLRMVEEKVALQLGIV